MDEKRVFLINMAKDIYDLINNEVTIMLLVILKHTEGWNMSNTTFGSRNR